MPDGSSMQEMLGESNELQIFSGGAIAVNTEDMRAVAVQLDAVGSTLGDAVASLHRAWEAVDAAPTLRTRVDAGSFWDCTTRLDRTRDAGQDYASRVRLMADAFEYADLRARRETLGVGFPADLQKRLDLLASDSQVTEEADRWLGIWDGNRYSGGEVAGDAAPWASAVLPALLGSGPGGFLAGFLPVAIGAGVELVRALGMGAVGPGERLIETGVQVSLERTVNLDRSAGPVRPPSGTRAAFERTRENGGDQQIRIDKYTMPDGTTQYQVFIDGTEDKLNGDDNPWDMRSNIDMYSYRHVSASYEAVRQAMADAGIEQGDTIDIVGYSQGGMIGSFLAAGGDFDVRSLTTFGNPTPPALGERTLVAELRNTNDLVGGALSANGSAGMTGSKDSFVAMRDTGSHTVIGAHLDEAYLRTAELVDDSGDPRSEALQARWGELNAATKVESFSYRAHEKA
ncbi:hypothetical protein ACFVAE_11530 [Microbacterium sp. NPDC057659]|uniref:hypothetical protein n=1 Tax=Microbacterium sp. NPDC057659 TaxID=3346198 RepID=UPI00366F6867